MGCFTLEGPKPIQAIQIGISFGPQLLTGIFWAAEIRKRALATLRNANDEKALKLRISVAQKEALAEQTWKERMMRILEEGRNHHWNHH
jgi:hypothetical protein